MNNKLRFAVLFTVILSLILFHYGIEQKESVKKDTNNTNLQSEIKTNSVPKKKILTFEEFTDVFRSDAFSEGEFLKHCESLVNGKNPTQAYRMYKQYSKSKPKIKSGTLIYISRTIGEDSGDPIKITYKLKFRMNNDDEWKLFATSYNYDLDIDALR